MLQWNLSPFLSCFQVKVNHKPINFWCLTNQQEFLQLCFLKIQKKSQGLFKNFVQKSVHKVCMYIQLFIHKFTISRLRVLTMVLNLDFTIYFKTHNIIVVSYAHRHLRIIKGLLIKQSAAFNRPEMLNPPLQTVFRLPQEGKESLLKLHSSLIYQIFPFAVEWSSFQKLQETFYRKWNQSSQAGVSAFLRVMSFTETAWIKWPGLCSLGILGKCCIQFRRPFSLLLFKSDC